MIQVNWLELLNDIYKVGARISIPNSEKVVVIETGYLKVYRLKFIIWIV